MRTLATLYVRSVDRLLGEPDPVIGKTLGVELAAEDYRLVLSLARFRRHQRRNGTTGEL